MQRIPVTILLCFYIFSACGSRSKTTLYREAYERQYKHIRDVYVGELLQQQILNKGSNERLYADIDLILKLCRNTDSLLETGRILSADEISALESEYRNFQENMREAFVARQLKMPRVVFPEFTKKETRNIQMVKLTQMNLDMLHHTLLWISLQYGQYPYQEQGMYRYPEPRLVEAFVKNDTLNLSFIYGTSSGMFQSDCLDSLIVHEITGKKVRRPLVKNRFYGGSPDHIDRLEFVYRFNCDTGNSTFYEVYF